MIDSMKAVVDRLHIKPGREYNLREITEQKLIPWAHNYRTIIKIIRDGAMGWGEYGKSQTRTSGTKRRSYSVKGKVIINYLNNYGPALMSLVQKNRYGRTSRKETGKSTGRTK